MIIMKKVKYAIKIAVNNLNKIYLAAGIALLPILTYADGGDFGTAATHASKELNSFKITVFNALLVLGAVLIVAGVITILRKNIEGKWGKATTFILLGAVCLCPKLLITTATTSTLGSAGQSSQNTTQQFSAD